MRHQKKRNTGGRPQCTSTKFRVRQDFCRLDRTQLPDGVTEHERKERRGFRVRGPFGRVDRADERIVQVAAGQGLRAFLDEPRHPPIGGTRRRQPRREYRDGKCEYAGRSGKNKERDSPQPEDVLDDRADDEQHG